jgi:hypothetical protein
MANIFLAGWAALRAASTAASTCISASRAWSRKARPAAVSSTVHAAAHQLDANLIFKIADLAAEGGLRRVQPFLGCQRQAPHLGDCDEIAKVA